MTSGSVSGRCQTVKRAPKTLFSGLKYGHYYGIPLMELHVSMVFILCFYAVAVCGGVSSRLYMTY